MTAIALAGLLLAAVPAGSRETPVSLTISGGVSLGAFEAGYLYYTLAAQHANPGFARVIIATGASAGSVNALLSLGASCTGSSPDPRQSLFHQVWVPMGLGQLFRPEATSPVAAFSQASFQHVGAMVEEELARGLPEDCDVVLGIVTSRHSPRMLEAADGRLKVPVTEEHFVVRIRGRGEGRLPLITNYVDPDSLEDQAFLPEARDGSVPFAHLLDAVIASTSFPVAFPPRPVKHCVVRTRGKTAPFCPEASATTSLFVDGGVFDNSPLRLAAAYAAGGLSRTRRSRPALEPRAQALGLTRAPLRRGLRLPLGRCGGLPRPDRLRVGRRAVAPSAPAAGAGRVREQRPLPGAVPAHPGLPGDRREADLPAAPLPGGELAHVRLLRLLRSRLPIVRFRPGHVRGAPADGAVHPAPPGTGAARPLRLARGPSRRARRRTVLGPARLPARALRRLPRRRRPLQR